MLLPCQNGSRRQALAGLSPSENATRARLEQSENGVTQNEILEKTSVASIPRDGSGEVTNGSVVLQQGGVSACVGGVGGVCGVSSSSSMHVHSAPPLIPTEIPKLNLELLDACRRILAPRSDTRKLMVEVGWSKPFWGITK